MPLLPRHTKLPPPPELGEKTFWDYFPRRSARRILFLLIALGAVVILKRSGHWSLGGLLEPPRAPAGGGQAGAPVYHIKVTRPGEPPSTGDRSREDDRGDRTPSRAP
jgi:hypothetical protein